MYWVLDRTYLNPGTSECLQRPPNIAPPELTHFAIQLSYWEKQNKWEEHEAHFHRPSNHSESQKTK